MIIEKYAGTCVTADELSAAAARGGLPAELANALPLAAEALMRAESELTQVSSRVAEATGRLTTAIRAAVGQRTPTINPLGELQAGGPRFDQLIAVRHERISHLRLLARLWSALPDPAVGARR
jgi:hypothetical protein